MLRGLPFCLSRAARWGPAHPASPLSFCQRCRVSQCARRCCAPHRCRGDTSPVLRKGWPVRWCAEMVSPRLRIVLEQPPPAARPGTRSTGSGARPLRPPASLLHKAAFCEVCASRCAEAPLGVAHRWRALAGSQNRPYAKWPTLGYGRVSRRRPPVAVAPYAPSPVRPCACVAPAVCPGASRRVLLSGRRPGITVKPGPPAVPRRFAASAPRGFSIRPSRGLLLPRGMPTEASVSIKPGTGTPMSP